jgi:hypothetical protein
MARQKALRGNVEPAAWAYNLSRSIPIPANSCTGEMLRKRIGRSPKENLFRSLRCHSCGKHATRRAYDENVRHRVAEGGSHLMLLCKCHGVYILGVADRLTQLRVLACQVYIREKYAICSSKQTSHFVSRGYKIHCSIYIAQSNSLDTGCVDRKFELL